MEIKIFYGKNGFTRESVDRKYRFELAREWNLSKPRIAFLMLNPSLANESVDDPTLRKCLVYSKLWGCGGLRVYNLFNWRSPMSDDLSMVSDPIGREVLVSPPLIHLEMIVCAWGSNHYTGRQQEVIRLLKEWKCPMMCLGLNKDGSPKHPLYLKSSLKPIVFDPARKELKR